MVVHLVGLGGSLDSRVAGVVLELVGCVRRSVILCVVCLRCWCSDVPSLLISSSNLRCFSSPGFPVMQKSESNVQLARDPARELMPYAMITPVMIPLASLSPMYILSAPLALSSSSGDQIVGSRTGGVERPHGLSCN
jgi:hypothetical protein